MRLLLRQGDREGELVTPVTGDPVRFLETLKA
jgi:hypothetical protein